MNADEKREKTIGKFEWIGRIIGWLCLGIAILIYFLWKNQSDLESLISMQSRVDLCIALFIIGLIFSTFSDDLADIFKEIIDLNALISWIQDTKFDYREYICVHGVAEKEDSIFSFLYAMKLSQAALQIESKKTKFVVNSFFIIKSIVVIALNISSAFFIKALIPQIFAARFAPIEIEWLTSAFYSCVVFFVVWVVSGIVINRFVYPKLINKKRKEILGSSKK